MVVFQFLKLNSALYSDLFKSMKKILIVFYIISKKMYFMLLVLTPKQQLLKKINKMNGHLQVNKEDNPMILKVWNYQMKISQFRQEQQPTLLFIIQMKMDIFKEKLNILQVQIKI
ncbi:hypothetical protein IMG5_188900 [Ichthyophthirius multifiliis]|uniref:Transmembrane protein n=1 Tax=Ichthyophthirius multifiliis TaxID=5932 RepID=G0R414_ICHMU|nr:hypothetical protein IMG5_188900 [Ichthyophthirius multifiliis]EGR27788.1 hypothetical protein IMG5_188900 [Ichthyophthirius multifiliis]|eukprot:XP_004027133.1 hypothetical protein IMG5_188900 [Ichthyophthirius multifiliis]